jgi:hypothetical protein
MFCFMFFLVAFFINVQVFWMRFFSIWSGLNLQKACFSLRKSMVFNKSEVSQKYGFYHHFGVQKSTPGSKMWSKYHAFHIYFYVFLYEKHYLFMVYTVFTGGPAFSSFSFFYVFSVCLLDGSFLRLLEDIW